MNGIVKPEDIPGFAKNIYEEAGRLIDLVNDIIFLSKLDEDSSVGYQPEKISLLDMAKEVKARLKMPCQEKDVSIHIVGDDVVMDGVPSMVEEVVYNLCDNGIKYNKKGGRVAITLQQVTEQDISYAVIEVADT